MVLANLLVESNLAHTVPFAMERREIIKVKFTVLGFGLNYMGAMGRSRGKRLRVQCHFWLLIWTFRVLCHFGSWFTELAGKLNETFWANNMAWLSGYHETYNNWGVDQHFYLASVCEKGTQQYCGEAISIQHFSGGVRVYFCRPLCPVDAEVFTSLPRGFLEQECQSVTDFSAGGTYGKQYSSSEACRYPDEYARWNTLPTAFSKSHWS